MSPAPAPATPRRALRGPALTFTGDPCVIGPAARHYESDALLAMADGKITHFGPAEALRSHLPPGIEINQQGQDTLMMPGFIDSHVHFPQLPMIAACGRPLQSRIEGHPSRGPIRLRQPAHSNPMPV